ncbi:Lrp/AsnC family transcriptional regulator [Erythrobacter sp. MTPC3]|uniref:Lrp/AsnC family transcriptional regulator n=1 Tax=Erythrobacter sp. MTPC3 TaxID=3056564 RepID=UPI0036F22F4D
MTENDHSAIDATDRRILIEIQRDLRRPPEDIADAAGISVSSYRRRLKRLRASGVIEREVALVNPGRVGIEVIVMVSLNEERGAEYDRLKRAYRASPEVTQCYSVTGCGPNIARAHARYGGFRNLDRGKYYRGFCGETVHQPRGLFAGEVRHGSHVLGQRSK